MGVQRNGIDAAVDGARRKVVLIDHRPVEVNLGSRLVQRGNDAQVVQLRQLRQMADADFRALANRNCGGQLRVVFAPVQLDVANGVFRIRRVVIGYDAFHNGSFAAAEQRPEHQFLIAGNDGFGVLDDAVVVHDDFLSQREAAQREQQNQNQAQQFFHWVYAPFLFTTPLSGL